MHHLSVTMWVMHRASPADNLCPDRSPDVSAGHSTSCHTGWCVLCRVRHQGPCLAGRQHPTRVAIRQHGQRTATAHDDGAGSARDSRFVAKRQNLSIAACPDTHIGARGRCRRPRRWSPRRGSGLGSRPSRMFHLLRNTFERLLHTYGRARQSTERYRRLRRSNCAGTRTAWHDNTPVSLCPPATSAGDMQIACTASPTMPGTACRRRRRVHVCRLPGRRSNAAAVPWYRFRPVGDAPCITHRPSWMGAGSQAPTRRTSSSRKRSTTS